MSPSLLLKAGLSSVLDRVGCCFVRVLKTSKDGDITNSLGNLFLSTLLVKKFFPCPVRTSQATICDHFSFLYCLPLQKSFPLSFSQFSFKQFSAAMTSASLSSSLSGSVLYIVNSYKDAILVFSVLCTNNQYNSNSEHNDEIKHVFCGINM